MRRWELFAQESKDGKFSSIGTEQYAKMARIVSGLDPVVPVLVVEDSEAGAS